MSESNEVRRIQKTRPGVRGNPPFRLERRLEALRTILAGMGKVVVPIPAGDSSLL